MQVTANYRGTIRYAPSTDILDKIGFELDRQTFYNLKRRESEGVISEQEEMRLLLSCLESQEGIHVVVETTYMLLGLMVQSQRDLSLPFTALRKSRFDRRDALYPGIMASPIRPSIQIVSVCSSRTLLALMLRCLLGNQYSWPI